jgi:hypothetical protein
MSGANVKLQVYGVKEALKEINKINPKLRRQYTKRYKEMVKPILDDAKSRFPETAPLSGWSRPYKKLGGWDGGLVAKGVVAKINTRKARNRNIATGATYETVGVFIVQQKTGWGSLFDMAGKKNSDGQMVQNLLGKGYGTASRAMWPAYEANASKVEDNVRGLVKDVMADVQRNVVDGGN